MIGRLFAAALAVLVCALSPAFAQESAPQMPPELKARFDAIQQTLKPQHGHIALSGAKANLNLGTGYYFLDAADAKRVLTEGWGNPPDSVGDVLGMVFPEGKTFMDDTWGAVVTFQDVGYVSDKNAKEENYDKVLKDMQSGEDEENEARKKNNFPAVHLVGWAQPPSYDAVRHDLIWARDIQFGDESDHTLNYDVRHLGREGVLSLNMVSVMSQIGPVREAAQALARTADFNAGSQYADFKAGDRKAAYGLAGLIAAGAGLAVAKKVGIIGILLLVLKKGAVIFAAAAAGLGAWFRKVFLKDKDPPGPPADTPSNPIVE